MGSIGLNTDISSLVDAAAAGDAEQIVTIARPLLQRGVHGAELIGRVGVIASHSDSDGHAVLTLAAAAMLCRMVMVLPHLYGEDFNNHQRELPLLVQSLVATAPLIRAGKSVQVQSPEPLFPSELPEGKTVNDVMHEAVYSGDAMTVERLLLGLHGTGADYRTLQVRAYDGISTTFQNAGHPLMFAVRGTQLLDAVEWADYVPAIVHWLAPHLALHNEEPSWVNVVRSFLSDSNHSLASVRTRIAAPKDENALPLRRLILSDTDTAHICQGVYDALIKNGASPRGIGSVIALAATDLMQTIGDDNRDAFVHVAHGLLFAAATRLVFVEVQDIEVLPALFTSAAYINALHKELAQATAGTQQTSLRSAGLGGGLLAPAILETLSEQIDAQDLNGAFGTARRYLQLGNDVRALFAAISLEAAKADAAADQGHTLQIVQAAAEEFLAWPHPLATTNVEGFLHVALRAAAFAKRNTLVGR
jgi:hypothetical protein